MKKLLLQLKSFRQYVRNRRPLVIIVSVSLLLVTLFVLGAFITRVKENDTIIRDTDNSAVYSNVNPHFKIEWGDKNDSSKQLVRFDTVSSRSNPFGVVNRNIFKKVLDWILPTKGYGIEMRMSGARLSDVESFPEGHTKEVLLSVADVIGSKDISTTTQLLDSGREIGSEDSKDKVISKQTVVNKDVVRGVDLEYQVLKGEGLKEEIVINSLEEYSKDCSKEDCSVPLNEYIFDLRVDSGVVLREGWEY